MSIAGLRPFIHQYAPWMPLWVLGLACIVGALGLALGVHELLVRAVGRGVRRRGEFTRSLLVRTRAPGRFALMVGALSWAAKVAPLTRGQERALQHILLVAFIVLIGWAVQVALDIASALYMRRYRVDVSDNLAARKHLTQIRILRRAVNTLVIIVTAGLALMTIPGVRQLGVSLLAAGGAAGIIVGLALQPVLSNVMAGLQIALTQPIRIDDAVVVQGEFGAVEEINSTYVVIRLWDLRRMVVPLKYFLDQPFQNWTRETTNLVGTVTLYLDYRVGMDRYRAKFEEVVRGSPLWDGKVCKVQVNDAKERVVEVRGLVSAANAGQLGDLRADIREKIIAWLQAEMPQALPRDRQEVAAVEAPSGAISAAGPGEQRVQ